MLLISSYGLKAQKEEKTRLERQRPRDQSDEFGCADEYFEHAGLFLHTKVILFLRVFNDRIVLNQFCGLVVVTRSVNFASSVVDELQSRRDYFPTAHLILVHVGTHAKMTFIALTDPIIQL